MIRELQLLQDEKIRVLFLAFITDCAIAVGTAITLFLFNIDTLAIILLIFLLIVLIVLILIMLFYINKRLLTLNELLSKANNGKFNIINDSYKEGILFSVQDQLITLFRILKHQNDSLSEEKAKIHQLITDLSHQIKTPIASIKIFNTLLNDKKTSFEDKEKIIFKMGKEIDKLDWLSVLLLDISKLETGLINLSPKKINISKLITDSINAVYMQSNKKNIEIQADMSVDFIVPLDEKWTKEAFVNILDNAVKYTNPGGKISIFIKQSAVGDRIIFRDNGIGISDKDKSHVFERFYKGENANTEDGSGVGLYLADKIIRMQGGSIKVTSILGSGSEFEIIFYK